MLDSFDRKQEIFRCYRLIGGVEMLIDNPFVQDWSIEQKQKIVRENFTRAIETSGCVIVALDGERVIGFVSFFGELIGSEHQYVNLDMLHVSREYRRRGIGKKLWKRAIAAACRRGFEKFYISAHSSEESQAFYHAVGCVKATEIIPELFEAEPFDVHMEYGLQNKLGNRVTLRLETKADHNTVELITYRAFLNAEHADGDEALLVHKLRNCAAFEPELDFVAELGGKVIGNIMYTRSKIISDDGSEWETLTFGPVSVLPKYQRDGVGSALIRKSLETAREMGFRAVLIYGHESY
jgi:predicted N-acetyltransferase YhbS